MPQRFKRRFLKYLPVVRTTVLLGVILILIFPLFRLLVSLYRFSTQNNISPKFLVSLIFNTEAPIKKYKGKTNIALLGIAGGKREGGDLTDTIILLSTDLIKSDAMMFSIPRDLWLPSLKDKINVAYHYGEEKRSGFLMAKAAIEEVVGLPVHYAWMVDFSGFKRLVDLIGGIDIFVEIAFTDDYYPIGGKEDDYCGGDSTFACRYEKLHFFAGWQHMDGERVLKYVRSRMAKNEEGTDFARAKRQQQVILALKDKIFTLSNLGNFNQFRLLISVFSQAVKTDMNWSERLLLLKFLSTLDSERIRHLTLDTGNGESGKKGFLINPPIWQYNGAWVLIPRTGDFVEIQKYISCHSENPSCPLQP